MKARRPRGSLGTTGFAGPALAALLLAGGAATGAAQIPGDGVPVGLAADAPAATTLVSPPFGHTLGIDRARNEHLRMFLDDRARFDDPQGAAAVKFASDDDPARKGDDFQLTLFGVNSGRGEILYNSSMQTLARYGSAGSGAGRFRAPHGIAATVDGRVYVADTENRRVVRLAWDPVARALSWVGAWPAGTPFDVATDPRGMVWATDRGRNAVVGFADERVGAGTDLLPPPAVSGDAWPVPDLDRPLGLAVGDSLDPWYRPKWVLLYLVDRDGERLRAVDTGGRVVAETTPRGLTAAGGSARGFLYVALDYFGNVYVTDPAAGAVHKLSPGLDPLVTFTGSGVPGGAIDQPRGIAIWKRFGQTFVAEREGARYYFLGTDFDVGDPVQVRPEGNGLAFDLFLTEAATLRLAFLDAAGDTLSVADAGTLGAGPATARWGPGAWETAPPAGWRERARSVSIEARPTYSSRKKFSRVRTVPLAWDDPSERVRRRTEGPRSGSP